MKQHGCRQLVAWLLVTVHLGSITGCAVTNRVTLPANEVPVGSNFKIVKVILKNGEIIEFDSNGGRYVERAQDGKEYRVIVGIAADKSVEIDSEKVLEVKFEEEGSSGTGSFLAGFLLGIPVGGLLLFLIAASAYSGN